MVKIEGAIYVGYVQVVVGVLVGCKLRQNKLSAAAKEHRHRAHFYHRAAHFGYSGSGFLIVGPHPQVA